MKNRKINKPAFFHPDHRHSTKNLTASSSTSSGATATPSGKSEQEYPNEKSVNIATTASTSYKPSGGAYVLLHYSKDNENFILVGDKQVISYKDIIKKVIVNGAVSETALLVGIL